MISCLNETVRTLTNTGRQAKDEELHRKLDRLLENQGDMQREMQDFRGNMKNMTKEIEECKAIKDIIDTVQTAVGYQELFVKDFEKIHANEGVLYTKFGELSVQIQEQNKKTENLGSKFEDNNAKMEALKKKLEEIGQNVHDFGSLDDKLKTMERNLTDKLDSISKHSIELERKLEEIGRNEPKIEQPVEMKEKLKEESQSPKLDSEKVNTEMDKIAADNEKDVEISQVPKYKCFSCKTVLLENLPLREDRVSVNCQNCNKWNIVGKREDGHKCMYMTCGDGHYQQFPFDKISGERENCQVCSIRGMIHDTAQIAELC